MKIPNLIETNCYNCGSSESTLYDVENGYHYVKCSGCGLIYLNPRPKEEDITSASYSGEHIGEKKINVTGRHKIRMIRSYLKKLSDFYKEGELQIKGAEWIDIGCGFGEFINSLKLFSNFQLNVCGSEPNKQKAMSCKKRGIEVDFIDLETHSKKYDYISLLNVYSHLPNPIIFLKKLKRLLKPGGELFIETGHTSHLPVKDHQRPYNAPDHLSFANREIVESILERIGFDIIETRIYRNESLPKITNLNGVILQLAKIILRRGGNWRNFFNKYPNRDMYIRARLR